MKRIIFFSLCFFNLIFASDLLVDNYKKGQLESNTNLTDFVKEDVSKIGFTKGDLFIKIEENKKTVLYFDNNKLEFVMKIESPEQSIEAKDFILNKTEFNFVAGQLNQEVVTKNKIELEENAKEALENFYLNREQLLKVTSLYFNPKTNQEITLSTLCVKEDTHKSCPKCEYLQGADNKIDCSISQTYKSK